MDTAVIKYWKISCWLSVIVSTLVVTACGGGGGDRGTPRHSLPSDPVYVIRVEIASDRLLLTNTTEAASIQVRAYSKEGSIVSGKPIQFISSDPSSISVDGQGKVLASRMNSIVEIAATVEGVTSNRLFITAANVVPAAVPIPQSSLIGPIEMSDPLAPWGPGAAFSIQSTAGALLQPGTVVYGTGSTIFFGKVTLVEAAGKVTAEVIPVEEIFPDLDVDSTLKLNESDFEIDQDVHADFDVDIQEDGTMSFASKTRLPEYLASSTHIQSRVEAASQSKFGGLECDVSSFEGTFYDSSIEINVKDLEAQIVWSEARRSFILSGPYRFKFKTSSNLKLPIGGNVTCERQLGMIRIPAGLLSFILGPRVPFGIGLDSSAQLAQLNGSISSEFALEGDIKIGFDCAPDRPCSYPHDLNLSASAMLVEPKLELQPHLKTEFAIYPFIKASSSPFGFLPGTPEILIAKSKLQLAYKFELGSNASQVFSNWSANYSRSILATVSSRDEIKNTDAISLLAKILNLGVASYSFEIPIADWSSPAATINAVEKEENLLVDLKFDAETLGNIFDIDHLTVYKLNSRNSVGPVLEQYYQVSIFPNQSSVSISIPKPPSSSSLFIFADNGILYSGDHQLFIGEIPTETSISMFGSNPTEVGQSECVLTHYLGSNFETEYETCHGMLSNLFFCRGETCLDDLPTCANEGTNGFCHPDHFARYWFTYAGSTSKSYYYPNDKSSCINIVEGSAARGSFPFDGGGDKSVWLPMRSLKMAYESGVPFHQVLPDNRTEYLKNVLYHRLFADAPDFFAKHPELCVTPYYSPPVKTEYSGAWLVYDRKTDKEITVNVNYSVP